ncbi:amino acid transporter [Hortaea werneckii]|nr:amino acid transporter [Hortaea werneckii]
MEDDINKRSLDDAYKPSVAGSAANDHANMASDDVEKHTFPGEDDETQRRGSKYDKGDPFGDEEGAEVKYRTLEWWQAALIMIAETISLGILSLPSVLATIGLVAGIILIIGLGLLATYTGYTISQFKAAYPHVHNMADVGEVMMGPFGREVFGAAQTIFLIFVMGSHLLTFTIAMNAITSHATCTIVWGVVGLVIFIILTIPRTLRKVSYLSIASFVSILAAILITMIGVGIQRPDPVVKATTAVPFASAFGATTNIIFAFAGHVAFFSFISELKNPNEFPKALVALQISDTTLYIIVAIVVYRFAGPDVASPALGSTTSTVMKVAYGIALPTIVIAGIIYAHVAAKYIYVRLFRGTPHMSKRTWLSLGTWLGLVILLWVIAWIIAESIPVFNNLLGIISALFASWFTYGLSGVLWLFINWGGWFKNMKKSALTVLNLLIFGIGAAICGIGLYASGKSIHDSSGTGQSWSCADNSA